MAPIMKECDFLVIGGGSGGLATARRASKLYGAKAIAVERKRLGGTCVNVGCVPKKVTWYAASIAESIHQAREYGFEVNMRTSQDWNMFKRKRDAYVARLNVIYERNLEKDGVEYIHGSASLTSATSAEIALDDGTKAIVNAKKVLIATGGRPIIPSEDVIPGARYGIDSDGFFELEQLPKKVAVVGAGYIGVELSGMFHALGVETHFFIRGQEFLRSFDPMIQKVLTAEYRRRGVNVHSLSSLKKVDKDPETGKLTVHYTDYQNPTPTSLAECDILLWAIGRSPEVDDLNLSGIGVEQTVAGHVKVDEYQNTSVAGVYALGDVCGKVELTPVAIAAGRRLADRLFGPQPLNAKTHLDYANIPSVVFSHPEAGSIGLSEPQARKLYGDDVKIYQTKFTAMYYAMMSNQEDKSITSYKLICTGPEEKIVGMHIIGEASSEILQGFGVAIKMGATKKDFDSCVAIHPTSAEELVTMT